MRSIRIILFVALLPAIVRADVEITFTRPGGAPLEPLGRQELVQGAELWLTNRDAATTSLAAFEFRFNGGDFSSHAICAANWSLSNAFSGLSPAWINVDSSLDSCDGNVSVSGVTGSLSTPFNGPSIPNDVPVLIGTFDLLVAAPSPAASVNIALGPGSGIDDEAGRFGGQGIASHGAAVAFHNGRTVDVALRLVTDGPAGSDEGPLPAGLTQVVVGSSGFLEIWLAQVDGANTGLAKASVDVQFDSARVTFDSSVEHGAVFDDPPLSGSVDNAAGLLDDLGGATVLPGKGVHPTWARLCRVRFTATSLGLAGFNVAPGAMAFRLTGGLRDLFPAAEIHFDEPSSLAIVEAPPPDCNTNQVPDSQDIAAGASQDCNANLIPDECDLMDDTSQDCNDDQRPDECGVVEFCELQRLTASDQETDSRFGNDVAVDGDTAIIGARLDNCISNASNCGSAYVLRMTDGCWQEIAKLTASDQAANDMFGFAVAIDGDLAVIGARSANCSAQVQDCGAAYVFRRNGGGVWSQEAKLMASDKASGDEFGGSVSIDGNRILVGSVFDECLGGADCGSAYVFTHNGSQWTEQGKLTAADAAVDDNFGHAVSISGDWAIVGAVLDNCDGGQSDCGSVYFFHFANGAWAESGKKRGVDTNTADHFGSSVSLRGNMAVVGAELDSCASGATKCGTVYVFRRSGQTWNQEQKLRASDEAANDTFGDSVATNGEAILVGAPLNDCFNGAVNCGMAYLFRRHSGQWLEVSRFLEGDEGDQFGVSAALTDRLAVIGAYTDDCSNGTIQCGSVYTYSVAGSDANCDGYSDTCVLAFDSDGDGLNDACDPDIDNDGLPNGSDECDYAPLGHAAGGDGRPRGDMDEDCDVDLGDYQFFVPCLAPGGPTGPPSSAECNASFDYAPDSRVNLADFAVLQRAFTTSHP